ncbi:uncharacterized protein BDZ99DRAFT_456900 [Mytilinidion resinicola]|uniref:Uncharacterized protein n=1 Tax=Mytilinidion resinicola TaxID=574789 RepID=A0A6A6ZA02_9PEZI|nr:uncharacterized protein BDZ99DRAFT_456900 [Mytilinidion resinicola]KAF2817114.1 hypothetical protein BDZ99DRAFT_456900 [Mytilinidion resinicola]
MVKLVSPIFTIALFMSTLTQGRVMPKTGSLQKRDPLPDGTLSLKARADEPFEVAIFQAPLCAGADAQLANQFDATPGECVDSTFTDSLTGDGFAGPFESYILSGGLAGQNCPVQTWSQPDCKGTLVTNSALEKTCVEAAKLTPVTLYAQSFKVCCQGTAGC